MRWGTKRVPALALVSFASLLLASLATPAAAAGKTVHITKSESDGDAVPGATFTLYVDAPPVGNGPPKGAEDTAVAGTCTTAANGQCDITNVPPGDYWVSETGPPVGYTPAADSTLKVKRKNREVLVVNDKTPTKVSVNDPTGDAALDDGTHIFQFGPAVATTPDGREVFVAYNDSTGFFGGAGVSGVGVALSTDFGQTFSDLGKVPPGSSSTFVIAEPSVAYDPFTDRWLLAADSYVSAGSGFEQPILVFRHDGGGWSAPANTFPDIPTGASAHNPRIITWDDLVAVAFTLSRGDGQSEGMVTTSSDGGQTWGPPVSVTGPGTFDFISPAAGPDGRLFVTWSDYGGQGGPTNDFFLSVSEDGGATWSAPRTVADDVPKSGTQTLCGSSTAWTYLQQIRTADAPRVAVSPFHPNRVFVAYPAQGGPGDESDVFLSTSSDGGETWSAQRIPGAPGDVEMFPDLQVSPGGSLGLALYTSDFQHVLDMFLMLMDAFEPADTAGTLRSVVRPATPFPAWNTADPYDSAWAPCIGLQGLQFADPGSGAFLAWTDGSDPGPAGNDGVDPNIRFARVEGPSLVTSTGVDATTTASKVKVTGSVAPTPIFGSAVRVTLYRDTGDGYSKVRRASVVTGSGGRFSTSFARPNGGTCRVTASFLLAEERMPSEESTTFPC